MAEKNTIVIGSYIEALVMDVPRFPTQGETLMGNNFRQTWGGKGSNQAVQLGRLNTNVEFVSMVGKDSFGDKCVKLMEDEQVGSKFIFRHESLPTASGFIICSEDGHNVITIDIAALNQLMPPQIDAALEMAGDDTLVLLQLEIPLETALYAAKKAKAKGATVILNPAPAADLSGKDLSFVDYLTPNETEARVCMGLSPMDTISEADLAKLILKTGCKNVIVTLGEQGSMLVNKEQQVTVEAFKIDNIVDSTGAGDAYNAGLVAALSKGKSIEEAMRYANATGGLACTKADTIPSFHTQEEVDDFIKSNS